jgi:hypothetical protein
MTISRSLFFHWKPRYYNDRGGKLFLWLGFAIWF